MNKFYQVAYYLFMTFIFLYPIALTTAGMEIAFYGSAGIILILYITKSVNIDFYTPLLYPLIILGIWILIGVFFALDKPYSLHDFFVHYVKHILLLVIAMNLIDSPKKIYTFAWVTVTSAGLFCIGVLINEYIVLKISPTQRFGLSLVETPTNHLGIFTIFAMVFISRLFLDEKRPRVRLLLVVLAIPNLLVTFLTQSRSNIIALFAVIVILFHRNRQFQIALLVLIAIVVFSSPLKNRLHVDGAIRHRISLYHISKEIIKDYPITGIGFGIDMMGNEQLIDQDLYNQRVDEKYRLKGDLYLWPHNMFLSMAVRTGLVGLVLYISLWAVCFFMLFRLVRVGQTPFIRQWSLYVLAALAMFFVKGNLDPIFSVIPETILFLLFSLTSVLWKMNGSRLNHPTHS